MTYPIPAGALDDRLGCVGTSGSGKTYALGTAVERLLESRARVIIPDPLGVWWGLRLMADGVKASRYPVVIFGGPHADLPLTEHSGALLGEAAATMSESCILDLSELGTKAAERRFMLAFLSALYRRATGEPVHVVFDEADMWAPQQVRDKEGEAAKLLGIMETIVRRGRVKGFIPWLITQRPAVLNKDVLSQVDGLVAMKLTSAQDRAALDAWIEGSADRAEAKRILGALPGLALGQGFGWFPGRGILEQVTFPKKRTFDSSRTPKRGETRETHTLKPLDVEKLKGRLATVEQEVAASDPRKLKARVAELELMVRKLDKAKGPAVPVAMVALETAQAKGYAQGKVDGAAEAHRLAWETWRPIMEDQLASLQNLLDCIHPQRAAITRQLRQGAPKGHAPKPPAVEAEAVTAQKLRDVMDSHRQAGRDLVERVKAVKPAAKEYPVNGVIYGTVSASGRKILAGLMWWGLLGFETPSRAQVAAVSGMKVGGSTLRARLAELRQAGLIEYPAESTVSLTAGGAAIAPPPPAGSHLEIFRAELGTGAQAILDWLLEIGGEASRDQIAAAVSMERGGSTLRARLAELRTLEAIEYPATGLVRVQAWLADIWGKEA